MSRAAVLLAVVFVAYRLGRAYRWWLDNVPSHNCEEVT